ncbi:MAG: S8 family serine peptidase [Deltaproteobacteria bacterium]|nr:S8 family serine peptidase [Deltaproteobacteria bacterium]
MDFNHGKGVKVAVLDTGVDLDHPDLKTAIIGTRDFTGDGVEDKNGHGTHCAGVIGARLNDVVLSEWRQNQSSW